MAIGTEHAAKYLARYAEPEAALASAIDAAYLAALVVPVCREPLAFLAGYEAALRNAGGRVLLVVVVNAVDTAHAETHAENQRLLAGLNARFPERVSLRAPGVAVDACLARTENCDLLWVDRARSGARVSAREGVGAARKLGADLAASLWLRGRISSSYIASSDADVSLPADYFPRLASAASRAEPSPALLWPFSHEPGGDRAIDEATWLYEISLRYYVLGLSAARSCYAYQSIGSASCFDAAAYTSVRGFPKRAAGEDFYLLDKLAKVGPLRRMAGAPLRIRARASDRVPFGTGRRAQEIAQQIARGVHFELYSPELFRALAAVVEGLDGFADSAKPERLRSVVLERVPELASSVIDVLVRLGVFAAVAAAATQAPAGAVLRRRIHTWFDALRTLRFIHALRDARLPSLVWGQALASAPFLADPFGDGPSPEAVCARLAQAEAALPERIGLGL